MGIYLGLLVYSAMVSASEAINVSWRHQTPAIVSRNRSLAFVWHYRQSVTTVSPGLLAAQKVALYNILPYGSFYSFFFLTLLQKQKR